MKVALQTQLEAEILPMPLVVKWAPQLVQALFPELPL
tara:strand:+ start:457 stop:567 length:111 start_codon:yes stop_codon:yes gene_type:complete